MTVTARTVATCAIELILFTTSASSFTRCVRGTPFANEASTERIHVSNTRSLVEITNQSLTTVIGGADTLCGTSTRTRRQVCGDFADMLRREKKGQVRDLHGMYTFPREVHQ